MKQGSNAPPIIIKRKKIVIAAGHHGGAWKVAYADFVTAMMAFFLLMWLMNATTEKQRKGIADYFNPTIAVNRISGGGDGALGGDSIFSEQALVHDGSGASDRAPAMENQARGGNVATSKSPEESELSAVQQEIDRTLKGLSGEAMSSPSLARRIVTRLTDEGLLVEFYDLEGAPLFSPETAEPEPVLHEVAAMLVRVFGLVTNEVAVNGYVRAYPQMLRENPVWDLSEKRADRMRELLEASGFEKARVQRVTGYADRKPATRMPMALRNNRIEVILLRRGP